jgi:hypothetical protein
LAIFEILAILAFQTVRELLCVRERESACCR